jgi:hypothetical protein
MQAFKGRILKMERGYDADRMGYTVSLLLFVPNHLNESLDELEIYRRVAKVVDVVSPKEGA